jgi:hypothetical protein
MAAGSGNGSSDRRCALHFCEGKNATPPRRQSQQQGVRKGQNSQDGFHEGYYTLCGRKNTISFRETSLTTMTDWLTLLRKPAPLQSPGVVETWFDAIADKLLNGVHLRAGGQRHRLVEIEFYLRAVEHPDPFTHGEPLQLQCGRWYFHRTGGVYRGGSFKGLDLTFGDGTIYGGVLFRGLETPNGSLIDGPSLLVDYLLKQAKAATVRVLDSMIAARFAWDASNPLFLEDAEPPRTQPLFRSARVGLSLKNARNKPEATRFILRPYRYLTEPRKTAKGKLLMVLALHARGAGVEEIHQATGCPRKSVQRYLEEFEVGRAADFSAYIGRELKPAELCRLHGTWHSVYS